MNRKNWKRIKIFVSSTFKDMDLERDALKNIIVPKLNEAFIHQKMHISLVDLRHSVETDSSLNIEEREKRIFQVCMDEIDSCKPYFIGLVGHRYGWKPDLTGVHKRLYERLNIPDDFPIPHNKLSVTVCEFIHGLFSDTKAIQHSFILMRGMDSYSHLNPHSLKEYIDSGENGELAESFRTYISGLKTNATVIPYDLDLSQVGDKALQEWCNTVYNKLHDEFKEDLRNSSSVALEDYIIRQMKFINRHSYNFKGRENTLSQCLEILQKRGTLYLFQQKRGNGTTSLACHLYNLLSNESKYLCLFHNTDTSPEADSYDTVFYYWNRQILEFLQMDHGHLHNIRHNADALYEELCRLFKLMNQKRVRLVIIEEGLSKLSGHYPLKFPFNHMIKVLETGEQDAIDMLFPYIVKELDNRDFMLMTTGLRGAVRETLSTKRNAKNVKWLQKAVHILEHLNHNDYTLIRQNEQEDNREENISSYLKNIIVSMPDELEDLTLFWIERLKGIYGSFVDKYLYILSVTNGLNDEAMAELTGRNTDWCTWFRYTLGTDIVFENGDGFIEINDKIGLMLRQNAGHSFHQKICGSIVEYLKGPGVNPQIYQRNYFPAIMFMHEYRLCLDYISDERNFSDYFMDSPAMSAMHRKARYETSDFMLLVKELIKAAPVEYIPFHMLNKWLDPVCKFDASLYINLANIMIAKLEEAFSNDRLNNSTALALVEIYFTICTAYINSSLPDSEERWKETNEKALSFCEEHINESLDWNAMLSRVMYDTYEGFNNLHLRWQFLQSRFMPVEMKGIDHDSRRGFEYYAYLLREYALLLPMFSESGDAFTYMKNAYDIMDKVRESLLLKEGYGAISDFATADWLSMALCINRMSENYGHPSREVSLQIMKEAIEKMFTLCNKYTHTTSKGVLLSELVSAYSIRLSETDPKAAMEMTDRMTDMCLKMSEYDMGVDKSFNVTYLTRLTCFMDLSKQISYMDMSFAWNLVARIHITQCGTVAVNSKYPSHPDDFEILMRLAKGIKESIWDRELDNEFALCTAIASKLQLLQKLDFPDKNEAMELIRTYKTLEERSDIHYRKRNTRQSNEIRTIEEDLTRLIKGKPERISREDLEMMIENEEFNTIIDLFKDSSTASPEEFYYYGLALLRNGKASQAYRLYKILSDISNIPEGYKFSCTVNCMIATLVAGMTREFESLYKSLSSGDKNDSDIVLLYQIYLKLIASGKLDMEKPYGYML